MCVLRWPRYVIGGAVAAAVLAGCAPAGPQSTAVPLALSQSATNVRPSSAFGASNTLIARVAARAVQASVGESCPAIKASVAHFFSSDAADEAVDVIKYQGLKQVGQITGLSEPQGM